MAENRKLAAIVVLDVVGFSRLMSHDEDGTLAAFSALRDQTIEPAVAQHKGRLVKWMGDGALIEFKSVVEAVRAAIAIQDGALERNAGVDGDRRMDLRIGIHLGDVVEQSDGDLMGDGVNVAARLEALAAPGAICLSEDAFRFVRTRLDIAVTDLGETRLKNIGEPINVYSVEVGVPAPLGKRENEARVAARRDRLGHDKPSIAVLPFTNMSDSVEQEYFVDGMVEDIITALSRFDELFVVARNSTFVYKGRAVEIRRIGRELGVRYVLEGSVRKAGQRIRITGQLIDAETGTHLWADKYDGRLDDVFDLQDEITASVVGTLEPTIRTSEIERARRKPAEHVGAYDLYLQALPHVYAIKEADNRVALGLLTRATALDESFAPAFAHAAWCLVQRITRFWSQYCDDDIAQAVAWGRRALDVGGNDAKAVVLGGFALVMLRQDYSVGMNALHRAVEINPGSGFVNSMAGCALVFCDETEAGMRLIERGLAQGPKDPNTYATLTVAAAGHLFSGNPEMALALVNRALTHHATLDSAHWVRTVALHNLGRMEDARAAAVKLLEAYPQASTSRYERVLPIRSKNSLAMVIDALREAGIPE
ncbi:MAG: adenylate/guanylate cyclase domain-containing protein [Devosia sp.]